MIQPNSLDHTIPNRFGHDVLRVLLVVELKLDADVLEGDLGVGEGDLMNSGFDDVVAETKDEGEGGVGLEGGGVGGEGCLEGGEVSDSDGWEVGWVGKMVEGDEEGMGGRKRGGRRRGEEEEEWREVRRKRRVERVSFKLARKRA